MRSPSLDPGIEEFLNKLVVYSVNLVAIFAAGGGELGEQETEVNQCYRHLRRRLIVNLGDNHGDSIASLGLGLI